MGLVIDRGDGRIEITCKHGVGHPSRKISIQLYETWKKWMEVHGCCGCCSSKEWRDEESLVYKRWMKDGELGASGSGEGEECL